MTGDQIREILRREMELAGHTPHSLSKAAGLKPGYIGDFLNGKANEPGVLSFYAIARVLRRTVEQLIGAEPIPDSSGAEPPRVPKAGDLIHDPNEAAILGVWRSADLLGRASFLRTLGFKEVPSVRDLNSDLTQAS